MARIHIEHFVVLIFLVLTLATAVYVNPGYLTGAAVAGQTVTSARLVDSRDNTSTLTLLYDNLTKAYLDHSGANPNAFVEICGLSLQDNYASLYIKMQNNTINVGLIPAQMVASTISAGCALVDIDLSIYTSFYPALLTVGVDNNPSMPSPVFFDMFTNSSDNTTFTGYLNGNFLIDPPVETPNNITITVRFPVDENNNSYSVDKPLIVGLRLANGTVFDSAITSVDDPVTLSKPNASFIITINNIDGPGNFTPRRRPRPQITGGGGGRYPYPTARIVPEEEIPMPPPLLPEPEEIIPPPEIEVEPVVIPPEVVPPELPPQPEIKEEVSLKELICYISLLGLLALLILLIICILLYIIYKYILKKPVGKWLEWLIWILIAVIIALIIFRYFYCDDLPLLPLIALLIILILILLKLVIDWLRKKKKHELVHAEKKKKQSIIKSIYSPVPLPKPVPPPVASKKKKTKPSVFSRLKKAITPKPRIRSDPFKESIKKIRTREESLLDEFDRALKKGKKL